MWSRGRENERENGRSLIQSGRERRGEGNICSAVLCRSSLVQLHGEVVKYHRQNREEEGEMILLRFIIQNRKQNVGVK